MGLCGYHGMDIFNHGLIYGLIYDISRVELCYFVLYEVQIIYIIEVTCFNMFGPFPTDEKGFKLSRIKKR